MGRKDMKQTDYLNNILAGLTLNMESRRGYRYDNMRHSAIACQGGCVPRLHRILSLPIAK